MPTNNKNKNVKFDNMGGSILGIIEGPVADFMEPTRNGRTYSKQLWKKVFSSENVKEMFENGGIPGELSHPEDRDEVLEERIAVLMKEPPTEHEDGTYNGRFYILNTPMGQIVHTLAKAGFKLGASSRGTGDVVEDFNGGETVLEDTYDFKCFDIVMTPAVKSARMTLITESLDDKKEFNYKKELREHISKENDTNRALMEEALKNMEIDLDESPIKNGYIPKEGDNKEDEPSKESLRKDSAAENVGADSFVKDLQEALKEKSNLEKQLLKLQKEKAVSDTKVSKLNEELSRYKNATIKLSTLASNKKGLTKEVSILKEELKSSKTEIAKRDMRISQIMSSGRNEEKSLRSLREGLVKKDSEVKSLREELDIVRDETRQEISSLVDKYENFKMDTKLKEAKDAQKLTKANRVISQYKKTLKETLSRYIESKAVMLGVSKNRIMNELKETYTLDDIDEVVNSLQEHVVSISKLPFNLTKETRGRVRESKKESLNVPTGIDDEIDDSLRKLANLY